MQDNKNKQQIPSKSKEKITKLSSALRKNLQRRKAAKKSNASDSL